MNESIAHASSLSTARVRRAAAVGALIATAIHTAWAAAKRAARWIARQNEEPRWPYRRIDLASPSELQRPAGGTSAEPRSAAVRPAR